MTNITTKVNSAKLRRRNTGGVHSGDSEIEEISRKLAPMIAQLQALLIPLSTGAKVERASARLRSQMAAASEAIALAQMELDHLEYNEQGGD